MVIMIVKWFLYALALILTAWLIPGISVSSILSAMIACVIIALINTFIKPVLNLITLPINILTVGIFALVLNALLFMLAAWLTPGIEIDGFLSGLLGSVVFSICSAIISRI